MIDILDTFLGKIQEFYMGEDGKMRILITLVVLAIAFVTVKTGKRVKKIVIIVGLISLAFYLYLTYGDTIKALFNTYFQQGL